MASSILYSTESLETIRVDPNSQGLDLVSDTAQQRIKIYKEFTKSLQLPFFKKVCGSNNYAMCTVTSMFLNVNLGFVFGVLWGGHQGTEKSINSGFYIGTAGGMLSGTLTIGFYTLLLYRRWRRLQKSFDNSQLVVAALAGSSLSSDLELRCNIRLELAVNAYYYVPAPNQIYEFCAIKEWVDENDTNPLGRQRAKISDYKPCYVIKCLIADELGKILEQDRHWLKHEPQLLPAFQRLCAIHDEILQELRKDLAGITIENLGEPKELRDRYAERLRAFLDAL